MDGKTASVLEMDRAALRESIHRVGIRKLHYFGDGRKVYVMESNVLQNPTFRFAVCNMTTGFTWLSNRHTTLSEAQSCAEALFGISEWNAV